MPPREPGRSASTPTSSPTSPRSQSAAADVDGVREQLQRLLNPLDLVVLTRERLLDAFDEAVERGRLTRQDASDLTSELLSRGRRQTDDLVAEIEALVGRSLGGAGAEARRRAAAPADRVMRELDRARRAAGIGPSFPIRGYDDLTAGQVHTRMGHLSPPELRKVRDYERRSANRKTVLAAIEQALG